MNVIQQNNLQRDELVEIFRQAEKPSENFRIGAESEKFGVQEGTEQPLAYGGDFSTCRVFRALVEEFAWEPFREVEDGPILGLKRGQANITLEPGAQLELSGAPWLSLHEVWEEQLVHLRELSGIAQEMKLVWLMTGFHPLARLGELPWVPKQRYPIMRSYLPQKGSGALDMMQRTATVQANFDWSSEEDGLRKLRVALRLSPLIHALFANSPFRERQVTGRLSERGDVWLHMDPSRSGLIARVLDSPDPSYADYVEWALDAGMFLFRREGQLVENTGQTFREFMQQGYAGHQATLDDFRLHLTTLFPEVRLKNTLEVRSCDGLPPHLALSAIALWTGILYDETALRQVEAWSEGFSFSALEATRPSWIERGLQTEFLGRSSWEWAEELLSAARAGLARRARRDEQGRDETLFLKPIERLVEQRLHPAQELLQKYQATGSLVEACRLPGEEAGVLFSAG